MTHELDNLLEAYRSHALSQRDQGTAFEKLVCAWLVVDPVQSIRISKAEIWSDWALRTGKSRSDTGIDVVATRHDGGLIAVQCKNYVADRRINKSDIDSFISASGKKEFAERLIIVTSEAPWSQNAITMLERQAIPTTRITLHDLRNSSVNWLDFTASDKITRVKPKELRIDQMEALEAVKSGLTNNDRGKLIMACGTGKTLTSLRIAEEMVGVNGRVLFLVPSLALMSQSVHEWCSDAKIPLSTFAVCSDIRVGRRQRSNEDVAELEITDLSFPATTDPESLTKAFVGVKHQATMKVVFATYHSIEVIAKAQAQYELPEFDLIICDEAHRTTGVTFNNQNESNFVKVHNNELIRGKKRLYMTATPRIYGEEAKSKAHYESATLASMDDTKTYGELLFFHGFARAVESGILSDYRVIVLVMDEKNVSNAVLNRLSDEQSELRLDDVTRIIGCWKALSKTGLKEIRNEDSAPMRRALAFCNRISTSKLITTEFENVVKEYQENMNQDGSNCEVQHVDGTYNASKRRQCLSWLKEDTDNKICRILSNARCLTEGVDVPALDAILFLHPRNSQIDVVQAVGRVMRKSEGKKMGYVILPVAIPPGVSAEDALNNNDRYKVVWQVLNALRAHDERLDTTINQGGLGQDISDRITIINGNHTELKKVTAIIKDLPTQSRGANIGINGGNGGNGEIQIQPLPLVIDNLYRAVMAKIVDKCGTREYWEDWAKDVARIAERHVTRISGLVNQPNSNAQLFFQDFLSELRDDLNESISEQDAIEMLAQHLVTRPVFDALFEGQEFVKQNKVSKDMTDILSVIDETQIERETNELKGFYASVQRRALGITDPAARQNLITELYEKFFKSAFPRTAKMLGIVYTPVEVVDFIIHSVNDVLRDEFDLTLGSKDVHILDPFTGTGTFVTRLLQSELIPIEDLERKYCNEIHANEIILLAYYIATINIESAFQGIFNDKYRPYEKICLTDTFALGESEDIQSSYLKDNSDRLEIQKSEDIQVIIGNPPWQVGKKDHKYIELRKRVSETYASRSSATYKNSLYDSYKMALRWASDRIQERGIIGFVTNGSWIDGIADSGIRACLTDEFTSIYILNLRGNARTSGELHRSEGGKIFNQGSRATVSITILVRNPERKNQSCRIRYRDIGDYLKRKQKLEFLKKSVSICGIKDWVNIIPNQYHDWINQRDQSFNDLISLGSKAGKKGKPDCTIFRQYSAGIKTNRDAYIYNFSKNTCADNAKLMIQNYQSALSELGDYPTEEEVSAASHRNSSNIHWENTLKENLKQKISIKFLSSKIRNAHYRPFVKQHCYLEYSLINSKYQQDRFFPTEESDNRAICVPGVGSNKPFSVLMTNSIPDIHLLSMDQCFPRYRYEEVPENNNIQQLEGITKSRGGGAIGQYHQVVH